jgi:hypothetical protein
MKINGASIQGASAMPETCVANVPVTTRGKLWYLHAIPGSKGKLSITPGGDAKTIQSVRVLRTGQAISHLWENGTLKLDYPEPAKNTPHDVIEVTFSQ